MPVAATHFMEHHNLSATRAYGLIGIPRLVYGYQHSPSNNTKVKDKLSILVAEKHPYGYRRHHILLVRMASQLTARRPFGFSERPVWQHLAASLNVLQRFKGALRRCL